MWYVIVMTGSWSAVAKRNTEDRQCVLEVIMGLRELGFHINDNQVVDPRQFFKFLGILFDTNVMTLSLPQELNTQVWDA